MALSAATYQGDGVNTDFVLDFTLGYIDESHIYVYVDDVADEDFTFINSGASIRLTTAPANGTSVLVRRITPKDRLVHNYADGALVIEENLDQSNLQAIMLMHESIDGFVDQGAGQDLNMDGHRILNVADPVDGGDAMNYDSALSAITTCQTEASNASASAAAAAVSAQAASDSEDLAALQAAILINALLPMGGWDASAGDFPPTPAVLPNLNTRADIYRISVAGTMDNGTQTIIVNIDDHVYWNPVDSRWVKIWQSDALLVQRTSSTGGLYVPEGTTSERPDVTTPYALFRFNNELGIYEAYNPSSLSWGSIGGGAVGGGSNVIFHENDINVTDDYTITTNKNAISAGPIIIDNGVTVTIPDGSTWTVV